MNRQGTESSLSLPSERLSPDAQQNSTLPTYGNVLNDFLLEMQPQTYASARFNDPPERPSVDRTSNNWCQHFSDVNPENNISDSGATTEPDEVWENYHYQLEAQRVEKSTEISHVGGKELRDGKCVRNVLYMVETYLLDKSLPGNARLKLRKQKEEGQRKKRLRSLRSRPSTRV